MSTKTPKRVLVARQVVRDLEAADAKLVNAHKGTDDRFVSDYVGDARKDLRQALRRAQDQLKQEGLRDAPQLDIEANQGG